MSCDGCSSVVLVGSRPCSKIPFYLSSSSEFGGRYLAANRKLNSGEVIMTELPLATAPGLLSEHICLSCHQTFMTPHVCSLCNNRLCSENCETSLDHLKECSYLRRFLTSLSEQEQQSANQNVLNLMLPFRLLRLRFENPEKWKLLMELESHMEERQNTPVWNLIENTIAPHLKIMFANEWEDLDASTVQKICGIIDVNSFEVPIDFSSRRKLKFPEQMQNSRERREVLRGTFYLASLMAHSCVVNVQLSFRNDTTMVVKSTVPIEEGEGIFVSYIDTLQTTLQRRQSLAKSKHFICRCQRCLDPTEFGTFASAIKCKCRPTGFILPTTTSSNDTSLSLHWICPDCNAEMDLDEVNRIEQVSHNIIVKSMQRLPVDSNTIDFCENILVTIAKKLHPNHVLLIQLRLYLMRLYGVFSIYSIEELSTDVLQRKKQLCIDLLNTLSHLCPGYSRLRGIVLYELHTPRVALAKKDFENGQTTHDQFISELKEFEIALKEAIQILIDEPFDVCSEGYIAKTALTDLKQLKDYINKLETEKEVNRG